MFEQWVSVNTIKCRSLFQAKVIANYDFSPNPDDPDELALRKGDIITVLQKKDPNWWMGEVIRDNKSFRGLFPKTYVMPYTN